jgi:hypothetical protein
MESGIEGMEWMASKPNPNDPERKNTPDAAGEWGGTGLCAEAQADGVPCTALGRECDTCGKSFPATRTAKKP